MITSQPTFAILITTKNRKEDLIFTLSKIEYLLKDNSIEFKIYDDGSIDGTYESIKNKFPSVKIQRNLTSKGYLFCRNKMLNETKATYAISLDDDAHFVTKSPLICIEKHFIENPNCGLIAMRIFWDREEPNLSLSLEKPQSVKAFVGCAHVWRLKAWKTVPNYPEWFVFYGEEDFASYQLFKKGWEINYLPEVLVNHRVDLKARKNNADYTIRLRRSLRAGWYLFFLFFPPQKIPRKMAYSIWMQLKLKVFRGDMKALQAISLALLDLVLAIPKIMQNSNRLTLEEYNAYQKLPETKIYWEPEK